MSSQAAKQVTKRWNLAAATLIKIGFYSCTISMKEHFIIQSHKEKIQKKSLSQNRKRIQKKYLIYLFTSLQIDGDTIYQMVGTCEPQTQEAKFIALIFVYL